MWRDGSRWEGEVSLGGLGQFVKVKVRLCASKEVFLEKICDKGANVSRTSPAASPYHVRSFISYYCFYGCSQTLEIVLAGMKSTANHSATRLIPTSTRRCSRRAEVLINVWSFSEHQTGRSIFASEKRMAQLSRCSVSGCTLATKTPVHPVRTWNSASFWRWLGHREAICMVSSHLGWPPTSCGFQISIC
jgi:hypothetical protein